MKALFSTIFIGMALVCVSSAQMVVPGTLGKFKPRSIGDGGTNSGVNVIPREQGKPATARYTTHIILSESRIWSSTDGKTLTGKLIAFEDLVAVTPQGAAQPVMPPPPAKPTVIRDQKVRLFINQKAVEVPLDRLVKLDQELIAQIQAAIAKKAEKPTTP
ncbi:MAG: hypothetical protein WCS43_10675 [Verrucomicrobiota bacterium]